MENGAQHGYTLRNRTDSETSSKTGTSAYGSTSNETESKKRKAKKSKNKSPIPNQPSVRQFLSPDNSAINKNINRKLEFNIQNGVQHASLDEHDKHVTSTYNDKVIPSVTLTTDSHLISSSGRNQSPLTSPINQLEAISKELQSNIDNIENTDTQPMLTVTIDQQTSNSVITPMQSQEEAPPLSTEIIHRVDNSRGLNQQLIAVKPPTAAIQNTRQHIKATATPRQKTDATDMSMQQQQSQFLTVSTDMAPLIGNMGFTLPTTLQQPAAAVQQTPMSQGYSEPTQINNLTIFQMFRDLQVRMDNMQQSINNLSTSKAIFTDQIKNLQYEDEQHADTLDSLHNGQMRLEDKVHMVTSSTISLEQEVKELREKIIKLGNTLNETQPRNKWPSREGGGKVHRYS